VSDVLHTLIEPGWAWALFLFVLCCTLVWLSGDEA